MGDPENRKHIITQNVGAGLVSAHAITLITLVITIIILLILAGVVINLSLGDNGLFTTAKKAKEEYLNAQTSEEEGLNDLYDKIQIATDDSKTTVSSFKAKVANAITKAGIETKETDSEEKIIQNIGNLSNSKEKYLYLKGDEKVEITGGWEQKVISHNAYYTNVTDTDWIEGNGVYSSATITKESNCYKINTSHKNTTSGYGGTNGYIQNKELIDFSNYSTIYIDADFSTNNNAGYGIKIINEDGTTVKSVGKNKELDISDINIKGYVRIEASSSATENVTGSLTIRRIVME